MNITFAAVYTALFTLFVPLVVAGAVPQRMLAGQAITTSVIAQLAGFILVAIGVAGYFWCATLFVQAQGTPAPIAPTKRAVIRGPYRIIRNPIYVSVLAVVFGQAVFYGSKRVAIYGAAVFLFFHLFVMFYEEPTLRRQFDGDYEEFCRRVPRWIPRLASISKR